MSSTSRHTAHQGWAMTQHQLSKITPDVRLQKFRNSAWGLGMNRQQCPTKLPRTKQQSLVTCSAVAVPRSHRSLSVGTSTCASLPGKLRPPRDSCVHKQPTQLLPNTAQARANLWKFLAFANIVKRICSSSQDRFRFKRLWNFHMEYSEIKHHKHPLWIPKTHSGWVP